MHFTPVPQRNIGDELVFICPQPGCGDTSGNRSVNLKTGKTACFRCNVNGNFVTFVKKLGFTIEEGDDNTSTSSDELEALFNKKAEKPFMPIVSPIKLPEACHLVSENLTSAYTRSIEKMAVRKRLTLDDMIDAEVMFTRLDPVWEPYAIFPVKEWDRLVLYQGRAMEDDPNVIGKRFPTNKVAQFGARYWVYNIDELRKTGGTVIVVESILNVLSLRKKIREEGVKNVVPVCVFKHAISRTQAAKILACRNITEICLMYDADATESAYKQATTISSQLCCTVAVIPPVLSKTQDPNDDVNTAWERFIARKKVSLSSLIMAQF